MKFFHLLPILFLVVNFSGRPVPAKPEAVVSAHFGVENPSRNETDKIIPWLSARKLVWNDFMSEPKKEGDAVASTSTSMGLSYQVRDGQLSYRISCDFSKEKSWGSLKTDYILAHEQAHFDITEIHARKLYEALYYYELDPATFKADIAAIYNRVVKEKEEMQEAYDGQSDHSRKRGRQVEWLERIDQLLAETEPFASYP
jgi:predicted secreted Zn-dependent protease